MQILLYKNVYTLPQGTSHRQSTVLFDPKKMGNYREISDPDTFASHHSVWSMLMALHKLRWNKIVAHVSISFEDGEFDPECVTVQFSIMPVNFKNGIPAKFRREDVFFASDKLNDKFAAADEKYWHEYFAERLSEVRRDLRFQKRITDGMLSAMPKNL